MTSVSEGNGRQPDERVAFLEDGSIGVFVRQERGGWYLWKSGDIWLAEPAVPGRHHPQNDAWRRLPEAG